MQSQWSLTRTVAPTAEPISVAELRDHSRIAIYDDDALAFAQIQAATVWCETFLGRQLMTATYVLRMDCFPCWSIKIPVPPLQSVTSITYLDSGGSTQTLSASLYLADIYSTPGRIVPAYSLIWPTTRYQLNSVAVTFVAGYASAALVPAPIKQAIKMLASHWYENREAMIVGSITKEVEFAVTALLQSERILDFSGVFGAAC